MKNVSFKKGIQLLGYDIKSYTKGYNHRSAFATNADGQLYYFNIEDLRDSEPGIFRRTAKDLKDYTGGVNQWDVKDLLEGIGYKIVEKRSGKDYNGN